MKNEQRGDGEFGGVIVALLVIILMCVLFFSSEPTKRKHHYKVDGFFLKAQGQVGTFAVKESDTVWDFYQFVFSGDGDDYPSRYTSLPQGGTWIKGTPPREEEVLEEDTEEAVLEDGNEVAASDSAEADAGADTGGADGASDGDAGGDAGDGGDGGE